MAKAHARAPILTINDSEDGFDAFKIELNVFDNMLRDYMVRESKAHIGAGCRLKREEIGNIFVMHIGKGNVFIKNMLV